MNISILWRLTASFFVLISFSMLIGYKSVMAMQAIQNDTETIYEHPFVFAKTSRDLHVKMQKIAMLIQNVIDNNSSIEILHTQLEIASQLDAMKKEHTLLEKVLIGEDVSFKAYLATFEDFEKSLHETLGLLKLKQYKAARKVYSKKYTKYEKRLLLNIIALEEHADKIAQNLEKMGKNNVQKNIQELEILLVIVSFLGFVFSFFTYLHYIRPIRKFRDLIEKISLGNTSKEVYGLDKKDEMGDIARSIKVLNEHIDKIVTHTDAIAHGDYSVELEASCKDDKLVESIQIMTKNLKENFRENEKNSWIQVGKNAMAEVFRENQSKEVLGDRILSVLSEITSAQVATLYLYEHEKLVQKNKYAYVDNEAETKKAYLLGEGIVGEAARKETITIIEEVPNNYMQVQSALGKSTPNRLVLVPFHFNGELKGLIELGYFGEMEDKILELIGEITEYLGISYDNIDSKIEIKRALEQEQATSEELQAQEEELRVSNERLIQHGTMLKKQKENLEKTSVELAQKAVDLELASKYKSEFLANMSHELRTPLNSLLILSHSLAENESNSMSADELESAQVIHESGEHLLSLINDILDISKVEAGQMLVNEDNITSTELVRSMDKRFVHMAEEKNISYKSELSEDFPKVFLGDRVKLGQIISNFISNALKFTQEGGVTLKGKVVGEKLYFEVQDSGIGIPTQKQKLIFESFQQADGSTSRNFGGTGLGLSIALSFTKLLGGEIELRSKEGEGSTFICILPLKSGKNIKIDALLDGLTANHMAEKVSIFTNQVKNEALISMENEASVLEGKKILLVDDDMRNTYSLAKVFRARGLVVSIAPNGATALNLLSEHKDIDVILMDIMMPEMDGHEVTRLIRAMDEYAEVPILAVTASAMKGDKEKCLEAGANDYMTKPVDIEKLFVMLQMWL